MAGLVEGKIALVTGAAAGIGRAACLEFAREGARVVAVDLAGDGLAQTLELVRELGGEAIEFKADVTDGQQMEAAVAAGVQQFGALDCAFNNAGIGGALAPTAAYDEAEFDRILRVNVKGVWLSMKAEINQMIKQGGGSIVNTSSALANIATAGMPAYVASKHAVLGLTRTAALDHIDDKVRINAVSPGPTVTNMLQESFDLAPGVEEAITTTVPLGRLGEAQEQASTVVWLCSDKASFVVGQQIIVDGGYVIR
jgi:NAD(P)-dependent dehydrogenase (short-subunit alcohol dehydrogenase family)